MKNIFRLTFIIVVFYFLYGCSASMPSSRVVQLKDNIFQDNKYPKITVRFPFQTYYDDVVISSDKTYNYRIYKLKSYDPSWINSPSYKISKSLHDKYKNKNDIQKFYYYRKYDIFIFKKENKNALTFKPQKPTAMGETVYNGDFDNYNIIISLNRIRGQKVFLIGYVYDYSIKGHLIEIVVENYIGKMSSEIAWWSNNRSWVNDFKNDLISIHEDLKVEGVANEITENNNDAIAEKLKYIKDLYQDGIITDQEYIQKRKEILEKI